MLGNVLSGQSYFLRTAAREPLRKKVWNDLHPLLPSRIAFFSLLCAVSLFAQDLQVKASVNPSQIQIGDRFQYQIEVTAPESLMVDLPGLVGNLGSFEVKDLKVSETESTGGNKIRRWELTLSTFIGGDFLLPPQGIDAWKGTDTVRTHTEPVPVRVTGRIGAEDEDILDIEAPVLDTSWPWWIWLIAGLVLAPLLFFAGRFLLRRLRKPALPPPLPPYEEAAIALAELRARHRMDDGLQAEFFFAQGQILRRYLHRQYRVDVLDATTTELRERIPGIHEIREELREQWLDYCQETDLVKFAKLTLADEDYRRLDTFADHFLQELRPVFQGTETTKKEGT